MPDSYARSPSGTTPPPLWRNLRRLLAMGRDQRGATGGIAVLTLGVGTLNALEPLVLKGIFDQLGGGGTWRAALGGIGLLVGLGLLRELATGLSSWLTWRTRLRVHQGLLASTVSRLHRLPLSFHRKEGVGAVMTRLDRGIQGSVSAVSELAFNVLPALFYLALAGGIMLRLDWRLFLVVIAFTPLPAALSVLAAPRQVRRERTLLEHWAKIYSRFNEVLSGIVTVRSFAMEDREKQRFLEAVGKANQVVVRGVGYDAGVGAVQGTLVMSARVAAIACGALLVLRGETTVGTVVAFLGYVGGLFGPVQGLTGIYRTLRTAAVSLDQVFSILDAQDHLGDAPGAHELHQVRGSVCFEGVHFSYGRAGAPLLAGIDLEVQPGEMVAVVGPSGSGKSTLMALLQRFYDPDQGTVRIDGHDLRELKQASLRRHIAVVLQEPVLFNDTVAANIAYGRPEASQAEIEAAARAARAHDFIGALPDGYATVVGERGGLLSAGERQRIAIARALLKEAEIIILDEATSALDADSEAQVQAALERLVGGRTTFVVAHRLSTVVHADRIIVLQHGRIVEQGRHEELMRAGGYYASLVAQQTAGLRAAS